MTGHDLIAAYRNTRYEILGPPRFTLWIDRYSAELDALLQQSGYRSAALITAYNPRSIPLSDEENDQRQRTWLTELGAQSVMNLLARNVDPSGQWPTEESQLVLGWSEQQARVCADRLDQNALLYSSADAIPRLVLV